MEPKLRHAADGAIDWRATARILATSGAHRVGAGLIESAKHQWQTAINAAGDEKKKRAWCGVEAATRRRGEKHGAIAAAAGWSRTSVGWRGQPGRQLYRRSADLLYEQVILEAETSLAGAGLGGVTPSASCRWLALVA